MGENAINLHQHQISVFSFDYNHHHHPNFHIDQKEEGTEIHYPIVVMMMMVMSCNNFNPCGYPASLSVKI